MLASIPTGATACREPLPEVNDVRGSRDPTEVLLDNKTFSIIEMATAHGAFTIEVEVDADTDIRAIAHQLAEPLQDRYTEILVYFYARTGDRELPIKRVQWTDENGYAEIDY